MEVDLEPRSNGIEGQGHRSNIKIVFFSLLSENEVRGQGHQGQRSSLKVIGQDHQDQDHYLKKRSEVKVVKVKVRVQGHKVKITIRNKGKGKFQGHLGQI